MVNNETDQTTEQNENQTMEAPAKPAYVPPVFNWDLADAKGDAYSADERKRMEEQYDNTLHLVSEHEIVEGTVVSISSKDVLVNIGYKSDGLVPLAESRHMPDLKIGDKVEVYIETQEDK